MKRKIMVLMVTLALVFSSSFVALGENVNVDNIHYDATVVDSHVDTMMEAVDPATWLPGTNIGEETSFHFDIPKGQAGGLDVPFLAAYTSGYYGNNPRSISRTLALINALYWTEEKNSDQLRVATTVDEIEETVSEGQIAAVPTIEGGYSLEEHNALELLHQYKDLGIKVLGFTWNYSNALGEGADRVYGDPERTPSEGGLTELGETVAKEMNRLGMAIDVSHMSRNTFFDVINVSEAPVIATHSGVNALRDHQRNLTDEQLVALAENGGVIGIVFYPHFIKDDSQAYIEDVVDHIDYAVNLVGIDHVGIGSDFDGASMPEDLKNSSELYKLTEELVERGYSKDDIEKILGKNTLRVLKEVEDAATYDFDEETGIAITPSYDMGEIIEGNTPLLTAKVEAESTEIDETRFRVIVDGIVYEPDFDARTSTLSLQMEQPLKERFHVVTFEAANEDGEIERETRIFYVESNAENVKKHVEYFADEGELNEDVARSLSVHLTAVGRYEDLGAAEKVVKHMESFRQLLDHQKDNDLLPEEAHHTLQAEAENVIQTWQ